MIALRGRAAWMAAGVALSTLTVATLLAPWAALGKRRFTSLDLISSASALELIDGGRKQLLLVAWMVIPILVAAGYLLAAFGRSRLLAGALVLVGPTYLIAWFAIRSLSPFRTLWGLHLGVAAGLATSVAGIAIGWLSVSKPAAS